MTREEFAKMRSEAEKARSDLFANNTVIEVNVDSGSVPAGAKSTLAYFRKEVEARQLKAVVKMVSSFGAQWLEPTVFITKPGTPRILYGEVDAKRADELLTRWVAGDDPCPEYAFGNFSNTEFKGIPAMQSTDWWRLQHRISMRNCGNIDPVNIDDYIAVGGYKALEKALFDMSYDQIIKEVKDSNIRGRGGAGFQAGIKWESGRAERRTPKYLVVNGHEGEPNVFKDRRLFEGDPQSIIEGLIIGCIAVGTPEAYIYVGSEHMLGFHRVGQAVEQARKAGLLGKNILGTDFSCEIKVIIAAGAYISGEASAMLYGIQGTRGMPRTKPPRSVEAGLWGQPTVVNNVETFNNIPEIIMNGAAWYAAIGTPKSTGTKIICLSGRFKRVCVAEIPFGGPTRNAIEIVGGGALDPAKPIWAVQTGAVSGGSFPVSLFDVPFEIDEYAKYDCLLGSASLTAIDESICIVDAVYYIVRFNRDESCGKCIPCRIGCEGLTEMLWRIMNGDGKQDDLAKLDSLGDMVIKHSLCGLGQAAPIAIKNLLKIEEFRQELVQHINGKWCRAGTCPMSAHTKIEEQMPRFGVPAALAAPSTNYRTDANNIAAGANVGGGAEKAALVK
jgi:NADH:ubiquinone oxidoreductase subunit F (NADH-binding)